jgi:U6 snRNA-associated Sm-like protein LSm1
MNSTSFDAIYSADNSLYMPGTASLIQDVDKQLMVILRDGRTLIGYLRSIDQYANLLLSNTIERIHVGNKYGDIPKGIYIVRGENVVLIGEVDFSLPNKVPMIKVDENDILELQKIELKKQQDIEKNKKRALLNSCLLPQSDSILDDYY